MEEAETSRTPHASSHRWCNGVWLSPEHDPGVMSDRAFTHGLSLFETILAVDGKPRNFPLHLKRIAKSCARLGWIFKYPEIEGTIQDLLSRTGLNESRARVRLTVTGGSGSFNDLTPGEDSLVLLECSAISEAPSSLAIQTSPWRRNERSALVGLKCGSYAENLVALDHARKSGFDEALFLNGNDQVCELATANIFLIRNGELLTPHLDCGCLEGVARGQVLEMGRELGIPVHECILTQADLRGSDELFATSSLRGITPILRHDDLSFSPGPVTGRLQSWLIDRFMA